MAGPVPTTGWGARRRVSARRLTTKRAVAGELAHHESGYVLGAYLVGLALLRRGRGRVGAGDLRALATVVALQPFVEWGLHRFVLHLRPRTLGGAPFDPGAAHRGHHRVPDDVAGALLGLQFAVSNGVAVAGLGAGIGRLAGGRAAVWTGAAAAEAGLLAYEWTHLLSHSAYTPRTRWYRRLRASHLRHHFRDDTSNFGITSGLGDRTFGTAA